MLIDFHAHFNSDDPALIRKFVEVYESHGFRACMSGGLHYGECDMVPNEKVVEYCRQYPGVLYPMAKIELWNTPPDLSQLRRYVDMGVVGFKFIYPYYEYDHDLYMPVYEEVEKLGVPVLFHTGDYRPCTEDTINRRPVLKNMHPINLDRICRAFPKLHVVMAHMGTRFFQDEASQFLKMLPNLYADLGGCGQYMRLQPDELAAMIAPDLPDTDAGMEGFRKLVLGSDSYITWPQLIGKAQHYYEELLNRIGVPKPIVDDIMGKTVASWLGIDLED